MLSISLRLDCIGVALLVTLGGLPLVACEISGVGAHIVLDVRPWMRPSYLAAYQLLPNRKEVVLLVYEESVFELGRKNGEQLCDALLITSGRRESITYSAVFGVQPAICLAPERKYAGKSLNIC